MQFNSEFLNALHLLLGFQKHLFSSTRHGNNDFRFGFHVAYFSEPTEGIIEKNKWFVVRVNNLTQNIFGRWYLLEWSSLEATGNWAHAVVTEGDQV